MFLLAGAAVWAHVPPDHANPILEADSFSLERGTPGRLERTVFLCECVFSLSSPPDQRNLGANFSNTLFDASELTEMAAIDDGVLNSCLGIFRPGPGLRCLFCAGGGK